MNETNTSKPNLTSRLMERAGKYYHIYVIVFVQIVCGLIGILLSNLITRGNSDFTQQQHNTSFWVSLAFILLGNIVLLTGTFFFTRDITTRLEQWKTEQFKSGSQIEYAAWRQSSVLVWNYGVAAAFVSIFINITLLLIVQYYFLNATINQLIYSAFSASLTAMITIGLSVFMIETLMRPVRNILLPASFELQVKGAVGARLYHKLLIVALVLLGISILSLAPLGYSRIYRTIYEEIGSTTVLREFQSNSILISVVLLAMGLSVAFSIAETITDTLGELTSVFRKAEQGDLKQRARVIATDELGELAIYFNRMLARIEELQINLEKQAAEQTEKLRASNEVGRIASNILDPDVLMAQVTNLIATTFDYYYVAIFLVETNGRWAEIVEATGAAGEILKARHHRLQVGGNSMVGNAIASKEAQVAMDVGVAAVRFDNPLLPNTRSELALPLSVGDRVIGALDVQSIREADFMPDDIATLQTLASQVATSIENARLFRDMDDALSELRQANRQYVSSAWADKLQDKALEYSIASSDAPDVENIKDIAVNLNLRDQPIGYIQMQTSEEWSQEDQAWVESLGAQVAIALENARLVEESSQSALRERLSTSIIQKLWSTPSVDGILQTAARELGRALEASEATIELKVEE